MHAARTVVDQGTGLRNIPEIAGARQHSEPDMPKSGDAVTYVPYRVFVMESAMSKPGKACALNFRSHPHGTSAAQDTVVWLGKP